MPSQATNAALDTQLLVSHRAVSIHLSEFPTVQHIRTDQVDLHHRSAMLVMTPEIEAHFRAAGTPVTLDARLRWRTIKGFFARFPEANLGKAQRKGTGFELTFSKMTVEAHGGEISIEDTPIGAVEFKIALPLTPPRGMHRQASARKERIS